MLVKKVENLEKKINQDNEVQNQSTITEKADEISIEKELLEKDKIIFKCSKCNFETIHENGLKIHKKKKHSESSKKCDLCDKEFKTVRLMKIHRHTHSFSENQTEFECNNCDFTSKSVESMEVHVGKCCYEYNECGLCELRFESLEMLELHLVTCEVYECGDCFLRVKVLSEMKTHIQGEHESEKFFCHMKMDRNDSKKVSFRQISIDEI